MERVNGNSLNYSIVPTVLLEKYLPGFSATTDNLPSIKSPFQRNYSYYFKIFMICFCKMDERIKFCHVRLCAKVLQQEQTSG